LPNPVGLYFALNNQERAQANPEAALVSNVALP